MRNRGIFLVFSLLSLVIAGMSAVAAQSATISGRVLDDRNRPIANTAIVATQGGATIASGASGSDGSYSLSVAPGAYSLRFTPPTRAYGTLNAFDVVAPRSTPLVVQLTPPMAGRVFLTGGVSLANGAAVAADTTVYFGNRQGSVGSTGVFRLMPTAGVASSLTVKGANNGNFSFRMYGSQTTFNQDTYLNIVVPVATQRVRVRTADGSPVASALIEAGLGSWGSNPGTMAPLGGLGVLTGTWNFKVLTDSQGWASIPYVPMAQPTSAGYRVTPPRGVPYLLEQFQRVTGNGDITLTLTQQVSTMSGTVKDQSGAGLAGAIIGYGTASATTDAAGTFSKSVAAGISGNYNISYGLGSERASSFRFSITPFGIPARALDTSKSQAFVVGLDNVSVRVVDASGAPVSNAHVTLTDQDGYALRGTVDLITGLPAFQATFTSTGFTNTSGIVTLRALRLTKELLGVVKVTPPTNSAYSPLIGRASVGVGAPVNVTLPRPTVAVSGTVKTSDGTVLTGAKLTFGDGQGNTGTSTLAANGGYSMTVPSGTKGLWSLGCASEIVRDLTVPLCVKFSGMQQTISAATKQDFTIPTYRSTFKVVDPAGKGIPNVLIKVSAGHDIVLCRPMVTVAANLPAVQSVVMASATTDVSGVALIPMVPISSACSAEISLDPANDSRYQDRTVMLNVGDTAENVIVLTIPSPEISNASVTTLSTGKLISLTGANFPGVFNVTVDGQVMADFKIINAATLTIPVPSDFTSGTIRVQNGGGEASWRINP